MVGSMDTINMIDEPGVVVRRLRRSHVLLLFGMQHHTEIQTTTPILSALFYSLVTCDPRGFFAFGAPLCVCTQAA